MYAIRAGFAMLHDCINLIRPLVLRTVLKMLTSKRSLKKPMITKRTSRRKVVC